MFVVAARNIYYYLQHFTANYIPFDEFYEPSNFEPVLAVGIHTYINIYMYIYILCTCSYISLLYRISCFSSTEIYFLIPGKIQVLLDKTENSKQYIYWLGSILCIVIKTEVSGKFIYHNS